MKKIWEVKIKMGLKHKIVFISLILITILCISSVSVVSASSLDNDFDNNLIGDALSEQTDFEISSQIVEDPVGLKIESADHDSKILADSNQDLKRLTSSTQNSEILTDGEDEEEPDKPDLIPDEGPDEINYVYSSNINKYFPNGILDSKYKNKTLVFVGNFDDLGKLTIKSPYVNITGLNANLKNIVFDIRGSDVSLSNLNLLLDEEFSENHGAAIFVAEDNANLFNLTINYTVPDNVEAYGILSNEYIDTFVDNLKICNCSIYFEGHNEDLDVYNCAVKLIGAYDSLMENNTIVCSLPLKLIIYGVGPEDLDCEYAFAVGLEDCESFVLNNNTIITDVNKRPAIQYPTLDSISISQSNNVIVSNNSIFMTDFVTPQGVENFLYGINAYNLNDLLIIDNNISIITTGGKLSLGTAYPIQISGPTTGINITENNISSVSNGPNIGIYSQNFFGDTELFVSNNNINITGLAGQHEWALVTGIESQDTHSEIFNNTIEVHSIAEVNEGDNIYGVSYRQSTEESHTFNIGNNTVYSDGTVAVYLLGSDDSNVTNNTVISFNDNAKTGENSYKEGSHSHTNTNENGNTVIRADDYYKNQNININGEGSSDDSSSHSNSLIHHDGNGDNNGNNPASNPIIPGYNPNQGTSGGGNANTNNTNVFDNDGFEEGDAQGTIDDDSSLNGHSTDDNRNGTNRKHSNNNDNDKVRNNSNTSNGGTISSNGTDASPGLNGNSPIGESPESSSEGQDTVAKKAFKIEKVLDFAKDNTFEMILLIIGALILLIVGYKRKKTFLK